MPQAVLDLFAHYGYLVIAAGVLLENAGIPAPGHTAVLAAAFLASRGALSLPIVMAVTASSAIVGDNIGYWIGRLGGRRLIERHGKLFRLTPERVGRVDAFFARHGAKTVLFARFLTGLQTVAALFAGMSRMRWSVFLLFNVLGALLWTAVYCTLGYFFGQSWELLHRWIGRVGLFGLALVLFIALFVLVRRHRTRIERLRPLLVPALALGAVGVFAKIAEDVTERETGAFDHAVSLGLHRLDSPIMDVLMRAFTFVGSFPVVAAVVVGVVICRLRDKDRRGAFALAGVVVVAELLNFALKQAFHRERPDLFQEIATLHTYSFPSGHAMAGAAIYGMVAVLIARAHPRMERIGFAVAFTLVLLIGISRIFLGVHWVTDVLAGFAAGGFVLLVASYVLGMADAEASRDL